MCYVMDEVLVAVTSVIVQIQCTQASFVILWLVIPCRGVST